MKNIKKCSCGSKEFQVTETIVYEAIMIKDVLTCSKVENNLVDAVHCAKCGKEYGAGIFKQIEFEI